MSKAGAEQQEQQADTREATLALCSTSVHPHSCPRHRRFFPEEKDYLVTKGDDSGQSVMSSYHRECGVQILPSPVGTERPHRARWVAWLCPWGLEEQTLGHPKGISSLPSVPLKMPLPVGQMTGLWVPMLVPRGG